MPKTETPSNSPRNNCLALVFRNESASTLRDWLFWIYPKGRKSVAISLQAHQGWTLLEPDPNVGFSINHSGTMTSGKGLWLKGQLAPQSCLRDVAIARNMMGHRWWHVARPRVWLYRAVVGGALAFLAGNHSLILAAVAFFTPLLVRSPLTPAGLYHYAKAREFLPPALRPDRHGEVQSPIFNPLAEGNQ